MHYNMNTNLSKTFKNIIRQGMSIFELAAVNGKHYFHEIHLV